MKGKKLQRILREWYKPTKQGERARKILGGELGVQGQAGAIGEDTDEVETGEKEGSGS